MFWNVIRLIILRISFFYFDQFVSNKSYHFFFSKKINFVDFHLNSIFVFNLRRSVFLVYQSKTSMRFLMKKEKDNDIITFSYCTQTSENCSFKYFIFFLFLVNKNYLLLNFYTDFKILFDQISDNRINHMIFWRKINNNFDLNKFSTFFFVEWFFINCKNKI